MIQISISHTSVLAPGTSTSSNTLWVWQISSTILYFTFMDYPGFTSFENHTLFPIANLQFHRQATTYSQSKFLDQPSYLQ